MNKNSVAGNKSRVHHLKHHPLVVPVTMFMVLFFITLAGFIGLGGETIGASDTRVIRLSIDGEPRVVPTRANTVAELLEKQAVFVGEKDIVEPGLETEITHTNFEINVYKARPLMVVDNDEEVFIVSAHPLPKDVAEEAGLTVYPEDILERAPPEIVEPTIAIQEGLIAERIIITRAVPVNLNLYGSTFEIRTHAKTVRELVEERGIEFSESSVFPDLDTPLGDGAVVFVTHPGKQITMVEETIEPGQEIIEDHTLPFGQRRVRVAGEPGRQIVVYEISPDGSRHILQQVILKQPVKRVEVRGTKGVSGNNAAILHALRMCEAGGNYTIISANGLYHGAYQFLISTWDARAREVRPDLVGVRPDRASPADQDFMVIYNARRSSGGFWSQHPGCSNKLSLPQFPYPD